jgi:hypothetical protein
VLTPEKKNSFGSKKVATTSASPESEFQQLEHLIGLATMLSRQTGF